MTTTEEWLRICVIAISVIVAVVGTVQWRRWLGYKPENQFAWISLAALNLAIGLGSLEALLDDAPGGVRNYLTFVAMVWLLAAVLFHPIQRLRARRRKE